MKQLLFLLILVKLSLQDVCNPETCVLPKCRCFNDPNIPGKLEAVDTPQMIIVSFENNIYKSNVYLYLSLLKGYNPNGCPVHGSFYIEDDYSDYAIIKQLYGGGHEIGIHSLDGKSPTGSDWTTMYKSVLNKLTAAGIPAKDIHGTRVPQLVVGDNWQFIGMRNNDILYDTSCVNVRYSSKTTYLWPYTLDVMPMPQCDIGVAPSLAFPGSWEFMLADLKWNDIPCATPSACNVNTTNESFELFNEAFLDHYFGKRAPFIMIMDPAFVSKQDLLDGAIDFLQYARAAFKDVWIVTAYQALQWIQDPTPVANLSNFTPWKC